MNKFLAVCEVSDKQAIAFVVYEAIAPSFDFEFNVDYDLKTDTLLMYSEEGFDIQDYDHEEFRKYFMQAFKASYRDDERYDRTKSMGDLPEFTFEFDNSQNEGL